MEKNRQSEKSLARINLHEGIKKTMAKSKEIQSILEKMQKAERFMKTECRMDIKLWLASGTFMKEIWNRKYGFPEGHGYTDTDILYYDPDTFYAKEDYVIKTVQRFLPDADVKNQSRVHLWFKEKYGKEILPYFSVTQSCLHASNTVQTMAARYGHENGIELLVPVPLAPTDVLDGILRPNPISVFTEGQRMEKALKWKKEWPDLKIIS